MRRIVCLSVGLIIGSGATIAQEPAAPGGQKSEARDVLEKAVAALKVVKMVSYNAEYKAEGWVTALVPSVEGEVVKGEQSKHKIDQFYTRVKIRPSGSAEILELTAGCNGDAYFLIDPKAKTAYQDMDPAVLGSQERNLQRLVLRDFASPEPLANAMKKGALEMKEPVKIGDEDCVQIMIKVEGEPDALWSFAKKDYLPRKVARFYKNPEGAEAKTELTLRNLVVNPTFVRSPFDLVVPEGYRKSDEFAP